MSTDHNMDARVRATQQVFGELLGRNMGPDDDFFAQGGNSLVLIKAVIKLKTDHGLIVPARQFLSDARVRAVAAACEPAGGAPKGRKRW